LSERTNERVSHSYRDDRTRKRVSHSYRDDRTRKRVSHSYRDDRTRKRVLIVRLDGLGDTVLTTPLIRALHDAWPEVEITCIASPAGAAAVLEHPGIAHVEVVDMRRTSLLDKLRLAARLRALRCDVAITVTEKAWGYLWTWLSGAPRRIGFWAGATQPFKALLFWPTLGDKISNPNLPSQPSTQHEADRILRLLEPLGIVPPAPQAWLSTPPRPPAPSPAAVTPPAALGLHLSAKWIAQGYSEAWLGELLSKLAALAPGGLRISAGPAEQPWADHFLAGLAALPHTRMDTSSFGHWCDELRSCALLLTPDTGAVHVGAALGVPVVDVFNRSGHEHCVPRWRPLGVAHKVVLRGRGDDPAEAEAVIRDILQCCRELLAEAAHAT
jgi:ADP-heptose:LPS heptosyltransferase